MKDSTAKKKIYEILNSNAQFILLEGGRESISKGIEEYYSAHPSVSFFHIEGNEFKMENARQLVAELSKKSFDRNVYLFFDFEQIDILPQNVLLKSLEEIGENKKVIALCNSTSSILDTIISRSQHVFINEIDAKGGNKPEQGNLSKTKQLEYYSDLIFENDNKGSFYSIIESESLDDMIKRKKLNELNLKYRRSIESNVNKDLSADLLIYKILED